MENRSTMFFVGGAGCGEESEDVRDKVRLVVELVGPVVEILRALRCPERCLGLLVHSPDLRENVRRLPG